MRILYVGPDFPGSHLTSWRNAFVQLGHEVFTVNSERYTAFPTRIDRRIVSRIVLHPGKSKMDNLNRAILEAARSFRPEMTFFAPGRYVYPDTVRECGKNGVSVLHTNDDMFNRINQPPYFREIVQGVDCIFTIKSFNVSEFYACGAARVEYLPAAYDPADHFPQECEATDLKKLGADVSFIGAFRPERADYLQRTMEVLGEYQIRVWGGNWEKMGRLHYRFPRLRWPALARAGGVFVLPSDQYRKVLTSSKISLGLLNHRNRDLHTGRTFEIPACRGFMLAERTREHQELFEEDREAVYFSGFDEMTDKIRFYMQHDVERRRIADQGHERCTRSGYRFIDRAGAALKVVSEMTGKTASCANRGR